MKIQQKINENSLKNFSGLSPGLSSLPGLPKPCKINKNQWKFIEKTPPDFPLASPASLLLHLLLHLLLLRQIGDQWYMQWGPRLVWISSASWEPWNLFPEPCIAHSLSNTCWCTFYTRYSKATCLMLKQNSDKFDTLKKGWVTKENAHCKSRFQMTSEHRLYMQNTSRAVTRPTPAMHQLFI